MQGLGLNPQPFLGVWILYREIVEQPNSKRVPPDYLKTLEWPLGFLCFGVLGVLRFSAWGSWGSLDFGAWGVGTSGALNPKP